MTSNTCEWLTPTVLQTWLEWAGARLIAMPGQATRPQKPKVIWPDYSQNTFEILKFRGALPLRAAAPSRDEIDIVDEILLLPNACASVVTRRIVHTRALVHPINGRHLYPWRRIAKLLHLDHKTVKRQHKRGLIEIINNADTARIDHVQKFMQTYAAYR